VGFWSKLADVLRWRSYDDDEGENDRRGGWTGGVHTDAGIRVNSTTAMGHVAVMACVSILAEDLAKIPLKLYRRRADGGKDVATDHWLTKLLRHPNSWQTAFEFLEMMQANLVLRGNAYAVAVRDNAGRPLYMVPVHPDRVTIYEAPNGDFFYFVTRNGLHDIAVLRDQPMMIPHEDVLHIRWLPQWNSLFGTNRINLISESIGIAMGLERHQARFTGQGATLSGVLETEQKLTKDVRDMLKDDWKKLKSGPMNSGETAVLEQGLKWNQLSLSMVDSQFIESRGFQLREAARAFRIPPYKLGIEGESSGPSMVQQNQQYLNDVLSGFCERYVAKFEMFFGIDGQDLFLEWDYSHFTKADVQTRFTAYRQAVGTPWMSPNEARRAEGLPDDPDGDDIQKPTNMAPLSWVPTEMHGRPTTVDEAPPGSDSTGTPAEGGDGDPNRLPADDKPPGV
jgi:HK97 family phage portal protein